MTHYPKIIAITGGIGAGKSVVATVMRHAGYSVYDCDSRAKQLMNQLPSIRKALTQRFGNNVYGDDGGLNRNELSNIIFKDNDALLFVNSVVHPAVRNDILKWSKQQQSSSVFIETAILREGGLDNMIDEVWNVTAPLEVRIERVTRRNATTRDKVIERINSQHEITEDIGKPITTIVNDNISPVLPQVMQALKG